MTLGLSFSGRSSRAVPPSLLTLLLVICGCSADPAGVGTGPAAGREYHTLIKLKSSTQDAPLSGLDIFVFRDGAVKSLDSYCHTDIPASGTIDVVSGKGDRILAVLAGASLKPSQIALIRSLEDMEALSVEYRDETDGNVVLSGCTVFSSGQDTPATVILEPLMSKITVRLNGKLEGKLKGMKLTDVQAYLTDVNGNCQPFRSDGFRPSEIINAGGLRQEDMAGMNSPSLAFMRPRVRREDARETVFEPFDLYCYPNDVCEESAGSPFTKLVIQADIGSDTYYYPIPVNREGFGYAPGSGRAGIRRNVNYIYDITISKEGSGDPCTPVDGSQQVTEGWAAFHPGDFVSAKIGDSVHIWCEVYPEDTPVELDMELLDGDVQRGIYSYALDSDGKGVVLTMESKGTGMVYLEAHGIVNQAFLCVIVVN